jgi:hypothetical protein
MHLPLTILKAVGQPILGTEILDRQYPQCELWAPLSAGDTDDDGRNVLCIDEGVEVFRVGNIGKMNDVGGDLREFASHFLSGSQVQLDRFARAALKNADDDRIRLQSSFLLGGQTGTGDCCNNYCQKD